jgi:hypothetical protein
MSGLLHWRRHVTLKYQVIHRMRWQQNTPSKTPSKIENFLWNKRRSGQTSL